MTTSIEFTLFDTTNGGDTEVSSFSKGDELVPER